MSRVKPWSAAMWLANSLILLQFRCMSLPQLMHFKWKWLPQSGEICEY